MLNFITTVSSTASIRLFTLLNGQKAGTDSFGNVYYRGKPRRNQKRERRWVIYQGVADASRVPPEWHGWLHHQTDTVPQETNPLRRDWQKPARPNMTGTDQAYKPPGHPDNIGMREQATGDYHPWTPSNAQQTK